MNTIVATASRFYTHGFITILIIGIIFTLIGLLVGWFAWRHCRANAERIERANEKLEAKLASSNKGIESLRDQITELETTLTS